MKFSLISTIFALGGMSASLSSADSIPYAQSGQLAPTTHLVGTGGDVIAYFAGSQAAFSEQVGMYVNGVLSPAGFVFPNHDTANGFSVNLGHAAAGADVVFALQVYDFWVGKDPTGTSTTPNLHYLGTPTYTVYSAPTSSGIGPDGVYLLANSDGSNHAFITDYYANQINGIPVAGTYVAFEDLLTNGASGNYSDLNYRDEQFVFTGISVVPEPTSIALLGVGLLALLGFSKSRSPAI